MSKVTVLKIEQAIIVPSTQGADKKISKVKMNKRVDEVRKFLSQKFSGYTSVRGIGGWYSGKKHRLIKEDVVKVTSFASANDYKKNKHLVARKIRGWGKKWGQESMGYENEGDLYLYDTRKKKLKARLKKRFK